MSSLTEFLKLFKWDKNTDGSEKFNIDTALNENIDKIEANAKSVNTAIGTLSSLTTTDKTSLVNALNELRLQTRSYTNGNNVQYTSALTERTFDEIMGLGLPSVFCINGNETTVNGAGFPEGAYGYGLLLTFNASSDYARTQIYIPDGISGIYWRTRVGGSWNYLKSPKITTGKEFPTDEYIDDKRVYRKRIKIDALPNENTISVAHGLSNVTFVRMQGTATNGSTSIPLPFLNVLEPSYSVSLQTDSTNITLKTGTGSNKSTYSGYVDLYYTKNS